MDAITALVKEHYAELYRYAYRLCGRAADAEDLTQQTFLVAQQCLHQVREAEKVVGWLFAVLRSCYLKNCRKRRPSVASAHDFDLRELPETTTEIDIIDPQRLQAVLAELPDEYRLVVLMYYFEELSYKEIAAELDVPIGTVMSRLSRAKSHLRLQLGAEDIVKSVFTSSLSPPGSLAPPGRQQRAGHAAAS